jgi:hypothetical protein
LNDCARRGDVDLAEEVLSIMRQDKFMPGPKAHHALILAYIKAGSASGALETLKKESRAGPNNQKNPFLQAKLQKISISVLPSDWGFVLHWARDKWEAHSPASGHPAFTFTLAFFLL